jgi:steroid delta-isomerase-like uncharacterized protein
MSAQENKALVSRVFEQIWNQKNMAAVDELFDPNHIGYDQTGPFHGREGVKQFFSTWLAVFPDAHFLIEDQIAEGDKVVTHWRARATHQGPFQGMAPTGKPVSVSGITILRIVDGKIAESWGHSDILGVMQRLSESSSQPVTEPLGRRETESLEHQRDLTPSREEVR